MYMCNCMTVPGKFLECSLMRFGNYIGSWRFLAWKYFDLVRQVSSVSVMSVIV